MLMNISIIGGGLCGIFAARTLRQYGHDPIIIEKSRSIGGRMATRRIQHGRADHGAQFFTVRSKELQAFTEDWLEKGWIYQWFGDDFTRYAGVNGMNAFIKKLGKDLNVRLNERIVEIESCTSSLSLRTEDANQLAADVAIITAPVPQALELIKKSTNLSAENTLATLSSSQFKPAFVGLITLQTAMQIGDKGIISESLPAGVNKIIANDQKGISDVPILSVYMTGDWSNERFENENDSVLEDLQDAISSIVAKDQIADSQLKSWRYAEAQHVYHEPFLKLPNNPIYVAGDSFLMADDASGRTRVESAILSGIRVGEEVHKRTYGDGSHSAFFGN